MSGKQQKTAINVQSKNKLQFIQGAKVEALYQIHS